MSEGDWYVVPSESEPETRYRVFIPDDDETPAFCDCVSYSVSKGRWKTCKHIRKKLKERQELSALRTIEEVRDER